MDKRTQTKKLLREWQDYLGLQEWCIKLRLYQRLPLNSQFCNWSYSEKVARIGITVDDRPMDEIEHDLLHELMHLVLSPDNRCFDNLNECHTAKRERKTLEEEYNLQQNIVIEHFIRILYRTLNREYPPHKDES